jgi:hypothetical protein
VEGKPVLESMARPVLTTDPATRPRDSAFVTTAGGMTIATYQYAPGIRNVQVCFRPVNLPFVDGDVVGLPIILATFSGLSGNSRQLSKVALYNYIMFNTRTCTCFVFKTCTCRYKMFFFSVHQIIFLSHISRLNMADLEVLISVKTPESGGDVATQHNHYVSADHTTCEAPRSPAWAVETMQYIRYCQIRYPDRVGTL